MGNDGEITKENIEEHNRIQQFTKNYYMLKLIPNFIPLKFKIFEKRFLKLENVSEATSIEDLQKKVIANINILASLEGNLAARHSSENFIRDCNYKNDKCIIDTFGNEANLNLNESQKQDSNTYFSKLKKRYTLIKE